uniref:SRCR domain-containing protein n=1 Tax=Anabas testudineus TaxID=64144 RepID=A0A3Q1IJJ0_ANATE
MLRCAGRLEVKQGEWRPVDALDWTLEEAAVAYSVRLVNGTGRCSGRLEVKFNYSNQFNQSNQSNQWSSVCEADFDQQDAEVVCRELGCGAPSVLLRGLYGQVEAPMWTRQFQCGGNESALLNCRSSDSTTTCSPGRTVGLTCSEPVRVVGQPSRCAGTLEVKLQGEWRPAVHSNWTLEEAAVACRELDCGSAVLTGSRSSSPFGPAWWISPDCVQSGYGLRECVSSGSSSSNLEITCSGRITFRPRGQTPQNTDGLFEYTGDLC